MLKWFKNLKIGNKLLLGFSLVIILFVFSSIRSYVSIRDYNEKSFHLINTRGKIINLLDEVNGYVKDMAISTYRFIIYTQDKYIFDYNNAVRNFNENYAKVVELTEEKELKDLENEVKTYQEKHHAITQEIFNKTKQGDIVGRDQANLQAMEIRTQFVNKLEQLINKQQELVDAHQNSLQQDSKMAINTVAILSIIATIFAITVGIVVAISVTKPLYKVTKILKDINEGEGDLTKRINHKTKDEIGLLSNHFDGFTDKLENMINNIKNAAATVAKVVNEISIGNLNLAQRTQEQASSLEETSSAIEELTATVKHNAENALKANKMSEETKIIVEEGNNVIQQTIGAMNEVNMSSKKISDIVNVVNEIAFQTNLLALNAAVEAARAGEQGRGFAVVATEVRNLAQRSAESAKEIQSLIKDSVTKIQKGNKLVLQTGDKLNKITESIKAVSLLVSEISTASNEQSIGIEEVNKAIMQMDQAVQKNALLVDESTLASTQLSTKSEELYNLTSQFKIREDNKLDIQKNKSVDSETAKRPIQEEEKVIKEKKAKKKEKKTIESNFDNFEKF